MTTGEQLAFDGIAANLAAATAPHRLTYREHVDAILSEFSRREREFTAEDVRKRVPDGVEPHSYNVLPSLIRVWSRRGAIEAVGWVAATRPERHGSVNRVWRGTPRCADE